MSLPKVPKNCPLNPDVKDELSCSEDECGWFDQERRVCCVVTITQMLALIKEAALFGVKK